ncbi:hypothetical protein OJF2_63720 [Aquisphaera giovannonii]|uniref:DUF1570 domain-containing protein n=1 Tax=Aquisphaera giovannonii TaxID=406548 RepID=A0A5B9WCW8_9BACT|nr:DUF1570 domain-containing protein [Aquisphaera giovannonii]QEH37781.1 hypothetical protein OJF2_63720 [Aquisphaera giovannonii]
MTMSAWLLAVCLSSQVPPPPRPDAAEDAAAALQSSARSALERERQELRALESRVASGAGKDERAAEVVRRLLDTARPEGGASRFTILPQVVPSQSPKGLASIDGGREPWKSDLEKARSRAAAALFELAKKAATGTPPRYAMAAAWLREVLDRQPDHREARRLLGYVPHEGGWARPFAIRQLKDGKVDHPVFGWVPRDWVAHLDAGELPAPSPRGSRKVRWLPAAEADAMRSEWENRWQITTEHFDIQSDVPLGESIEFARRLEAFYDVFFTLMADAVGDNLPLARRFRSPALSGESSYRPHTVYYFANRREYVEHLRVLTGPEIEQSIGYYNPPRPGKGNRGASYFFRDPDGRIPVTATLYHESSHQLLFETAGANACLKNAGNYWFCEGLGTYFETVKPRPDGSVEVGGLIGERLREARKLMLAGGFEPLDRFVGMGEREFNRPDRIRENYQQAQALAVFLMQAKDLAYREPFLDYVRDAYRGRIRQNTGRSLEDRLGVPLRQIDAAYRAYLEDAPAR